MTPHELDDLTDEERAAMPAIIVEWLAAGESGSRDKLLLVFERFATRCGKALLTATAENERLKADVDAAAGECLVSIDEMPPGSSLRRVVLANRCWRYERDEMRVTIERLTKERDEAKERAAVSLEERRRLFDQSMRDHTRAERGTKERDEARALLPTDAERAAFKRARIDHASQAQLEVVVHYLERLLAAKESP